MAGRGLIGGIVAIGVGLSALAPTTAAAFDAGGFAGGLLGGIIGNAMRPPSYVVVRPRYRVVTRRASVPHQASVARARPVASRTAAAPSAVVNPAADPFAAAKPSGPTPLPVANKP